MPWCGLYYVRRSPPSLRPALPQKLCIWEVHTTEVVARLLDISLEESSLCCFVSALRGVLLHCSFQLGVPASIGIARSKVIWTAHLSPDFCDGDEPLIQDPLIRPFAQPLV